MSKNRNDRYESAADLARDVQRYLEGQPVEAVGPNIGYRARKFVSKHRAVMSFATVILVTMCAATIVSTVFAYKATRAQKLANNLRIEAEHERQVAEVERDRAIAAESKLMLMERRSRNEAATARAIAKFNRGFSDKRGDVGQIHGARHTPGFATWSASGSSSNPSSNVIAIVGGDNLPEGHIIEMDSNHDTIITSDGELKKHVFHVVIGDEGTLRVTNPEEVSGGMLHLKHNADSTHSFVAIEGEPGSDDAERFLKLLVEEQRESFGSDDDVVANTLIEIGDVSLENQEWSNAENHFREARDILKLRAIHDGRLAKLELLLSKALMNQEKTAAAKETLELSVGHLKKLREVPDEVIEVILDLKGEMKDLDLQFHELGDALPDNLQEQLKKKLNKTVEEKLRFESRKK